MNPLVNSIAIGTVQVWEALAVMTVARVPVTLREAVRAGKPKSHHVELDRHSRRDIGLEPGSITWI